MRKFYIIGVLFLLFTLVFSCDNREDGEKSNSSVTIKFWDGNWQSGAWEKIAPIWEEEYPNINVVAEFQADLANDKYMLALTNGTAPDVLSCALDWTTTFGSAKLLEPLNDYIEQDSFDTSLYVPGAIKASTVDNSLYALPFRSETYVLYYNKDILAKAGYTDPPSSWDEMLEIAEACTDGDTYGYGLVGTNYSNISFQYITMLRSSGGSILKADGTSNLGAPAAILTAQLYKDLVPYAPASFLENDGLANRTLFANGKVAMYMSGIYDLEEILKINPNLNFSCAMVPTTSGEDSERGSILGGWSVAIAKSSKEKDAAWEFVKFLSRPDIAAIYTNTFTGTGDIADRYKGIDSTIITPNAQALQYAEALPATSSIVGIRQAISDNVQLMLIDNMSAREMSESLNKDTTDLLN